MSTDLDLLRKRLRARGWRPIPLVQDAGEVTTAWIPPGADGIGQHVLEDELLYHRFGYGHSSEEWKEYSVVV